MIFDEYNIQKVEPFELDNLLENGFRHFGEYFFRYSHSILSGKVALVLPLRINLSQFKKTKSQRRILNKNEDTKIIFNPTNIDPIKESLFEIHSKRFTENIPSSIYNFLSENPSEIPCKNLECSVYLKDKLVAVSFLDIGGNSSSSVYGIFDPQFSKRSLGIFTMLLEIEFSIQNNLEFYYPGYAYREKSFYDYKKNFIGLEFLDWETEEWKILEKQEEIS